MAVVTYFCQRFVTSWYSHKNKYLHKFQVWEDAVDKPSRLVKCWGKREAEPWLGGGWCPGLASALLSCLLWAGRGWGAQPRHTSGRLRCSRSQHRLRSNKPSPHLRTDALTAPKSQELGPFSPNAMESLRFGGGGKSMQRLIPSGAGPGKPVLRSWGLFLY